VGELRINISKLSEGTHTYEFRTDAGRLELPETFRGPVGVRAELEKVNHQLFLKAEVEAAGVFACDRCLEPYNAPISARFSILYLIGAPEEEESAGEDVQELPVDANYLELDEDVRQYAILAIPAKLLCKDSCAGLCPKCGKNRNTNPCTCGDDDVDPRWEALKSLRN